MPHENLPRASMMHEVEYKEVDAAQVDILFTKYLISKLAAASPIMR